MVTMMSLGIMIWVDLTTLCFSSLESILTGSKRRFLAIAVHKPRRGAPRPSPGPHPDLRIELVYHLW